MDIVRAGLVGAGWMGATLLRRLTERDDVDVKALCEANQDRGREVLYGLGLPADLLVADFEEMVCNREIDAVLIASPNSFHAGQALAAMRADKHIFCEKPCATRYSDFLTLVDMERTKPELVTYVDYILRFDTMEQRLKNMVDQELFGRITQIQVNYRHPVNISGDKAWKLKKDLMGDAIGMGINHALSVMIHLMSSQAEPVWVFASSANATVRGFEADPVWNIMVGFSNGATGFCFGNIDNGNGYDAYHNLFGSEGGFVFDSQLERTHKVRYWSEKSTDGRWVYPLDKDRCQRENLTHLAWPEDTTTPDNGDVVEHQTGECVTHFIECIKSETKSPLSLVNSAIIGEIGWAAQMSAATGKKVALPLDRDEALAFFETPL